MKKRLIEKRLFAGLTLMVFVLLVSVLLVGAETSSSSIKKNFILSEGAVSDEVVFLSPENVLSSQIDGVDVLVFIIGVIAIIVVVFLIVKKWLKKKPQKRRKRRKRKK
tara:strand:+ start:221 stop:544 length:324 start_codon:yes stop_codon:yes gene_type:complete